jgi:hypothetical protein
MRSACIAAGLTAITLAACQSSPTGPSPSAPQYNTDGPISSDEAVNSDPDAAQLHDISGTLLLFYALNKKMPDHLSDLQPMADADEPLKLNSVPSGQPYLYFPQGVTAPDVLSKIIVCDPAPNKLARRWCILMGPQNGKTLSLNVTSFPESDFQQQASPF